MNDSIIDQSYVPPCFWDSIDPKITESVIANILHVVQKRGLKDLKKLTVLDVGAGDGNFAFAIEKYVKKVVAVEPDEAQYSMAINKKRKKKSKVIFHKSLIENFSSREHFDVVICLTVFEHMPNAQASFDHIFSLMKKGAMIYFTVPNKLWPYEYHYNLLFLSWLPLSLANAYVRLFHRGKSFVDSAYAPTYLGIMSFFRRYPCVYEFIPPDQNAQYLGWGIPTPWWYTVMQNVGIKLLHVNQFFWMFSKTFIIVIMKK